MNIYYISNFCEKISYKRWIIISENMQEAEEESMNFFCGENWSQFDINNIVSIKIGIADPRFENHKIINTILVKE